MHASKLASTATTDPSSSSPLQLDVYPCSPQWTPADNARLQAVAGEVDAVVAIERAGPGRDGGYRTMRARRMDHLVAPLEKLLGLLPPSACTVGIGDGGNELGMGKVEGRVLSSTAIPNAREICCVVATRWLVASSVSNWGGYALAAALAVVAAEAEQEAGRQRREVVERLLVSSATERAVVEGIVAAGARDGITGERRAWVDGMPLETSLAVLEEIREIACEESS